MSVYLGIDLGTTGLKALLVRADGSICALGYREYSIDIPMAGYAEQNPNSWWEALKEALGEALAISGIRADEIKGIGLSGQMHGMVLVDQAQKLLYPAIIWCDQRSVKQVSQIREKINPEKMGEWLQNDVSTGFQISSLLWIRQNKPEIYEKIHKVLLPKDYIRFRLTGLLGTEATDACGTLLFNCAQQEWSSEMLAAFDIDPKLLPDSRYLPTQIHGKLLTGPAKELGLKPDIPVVYGGGDQPMQAVGNGILKPGDASITLGTGGQIFVPVTTPLYDPKLRIHTFCHAPQNTWYVMGATLNCCLAQNWFFDKVLLANDVDQMHQMAAKIAPGSNGLFFLPYLTGERTPHMNPRAKGMFFGLTLGHDRHSMARAVLEGASYALLDAMLCINQLKPDIKRLIVSGGGAKSQLWKQIIADMMNRPIYTTTMIEEAGMGAAICAMVGLNEYDSLEQACKAIVKYENDCVMPIAENTAFYHENHYLFQSLYEANKQFF